MIVYKHLINSYRDVFAKDGAFFYDRAAVLFFGQVQIKLDGKVYSVDFHNNYRRKLHFVVQRKEFLLPASLLPCAGNNAEGVRVVIKKVTDGFQVSCFTRFFFAVLMRNDLAFYVQGIIK